MGKTIRKHRLVAIIVFIGAAAWVITGKFASVGSDQVRAAQPAPQQQTAQTESAANTGPNESTQPILTVAAVTPEFRQFARDIQLSGETKADKSVILAARSTGNVQKLRVAEGQNVAAGDVLMVQEGSEQQAALANAEMQLAQRERELAADESLAKGGNFAELKLLAARTAKAAAEAAASQARSALDRLQLRAPFAGVIDKVDVQPGQWLTAGMPVATLLALDPIVVRAEVNELDLGQLRLGATAQVKLANGAEVTGRLRFISKQASRVTRTYPIEIAVANPDEKIPAGMTAAITLQAAPVRGVEVPRSALTLSADGELGLRLVDGQDVTHFAPVTLVEDRPQGMVVTGVPADMRIVVAGQDLVKNGQKVQVAPPPPGLDPQASQGAKTP